MSCNKFIETNYEGPLIIQGNFMKKKTSFGISKLISPFVQRFFILNLMTYSLSYKKNEKVKKISQTFSLRDLLIIYIRSKDVCSEVFPDEYDLEFKMEFSGRHLEIFSNQNDVFNNFCKGFNACKTFEKSPQEKFKLIVSDSNANVPEDIKISNNEKKPNEDLLKMGIFTRCKKTIHQIWPENYIESDPYSSPKIILHNPNKVKIEHIKEFISKINQTNSSNYDYSLNKKPLKYSIPNENVNNLSLNINSGSKTPKSNSTINNFNTYKRKAHNLLKNQNKEKLNINKHFHNDSGFCTSKHVNDYNNGNKSLLNGLKLEKLKEKLNQNINILELLNNLDNRDENGSSN